MNNTRCTLLYNARIGSNDNALLIQDGRRLLPGFHDNHVHALTLGDLAGRPDLTAPSHCSSSRGTAVYSRIA